MTTRIPTPRERFRERTRSEIKELALRQLASGGSSGLRLTLIAKALGLSGPALYRYYGSRDALVGALVTDAYLDIAHAIDDAGTGSAPSAPIGPRAWLHRLALAYRSWAMRRPHLHQLIQGAPLPGHVATPGTSGGARGALGPFLGLFVGAEPGAAVAPLVEEMTAWADREPTVRDWVTARTGLRTERAAMGIALAGTVMAWSTLHGTVSLEMALQFAGMGQRGDTLLTAHIESLAEGFRL
ncbi:TetR/AcrR family transcriptional regulator [Streptomyces sp. MBT62]|uniref:TetR/AcrR family transcriptional regulator n=1 Tax=Streptomyces sp. MBT62 TaxID=2800410 RepID=UPI00190A86B5|nr:TetR/AcrR family transcriptional regulator [Streptomyces sp. MBT62]MBK3562900.1 TetR/AcrR family transcriptional regulator [Streptomyces sp. MBT62]